MPETTEVARTPDARTRAGAENATDQVAATDAVAQPGAMTHTGAVPPVSTRFAAAQPTASDRAFNDGRQPAHPPQKMLYVGMGYFSDEESGDMARQVGANNMITVKTRGHIDGNGGDATAAANERVTFRGRVYDFRTEQGIRDYARSIGLNPEQQSKLVQIFDAHAANADSRDELAQVVDAFSRSEHGEFDISRILVSGHNASNPANVWGDQEVGGGKMWWNGYFDTSVFLELGALFPRAYSKVHHMMISACNSASGDNFNAYFGAFPKLQTAMAYDGFSPSAGTGAKVHQAEWARETEHDAATSIDAPVKRWVDSKLATPANATREQATALQGLRDHTGSDYDLPGGMSEDPRYKYRLLAKYHNIRTESRQTYETKQAATWQQTQQAARFQALVSDAQQLEAAYTAAYNGQTFDAAALNNYYVRVQRVAGFALPTGEQGEYSELAETQAMYRQRVTQTLRLRFWSTCVKYFAQTKGPQVTSALTAVGLRAPALAGLSRAELGSNLTALIQQLAQALATAPQAERDAFASTVQFSTDAAGNQSVINPIVRDGEALQEVLGSSGAARWKSAVEALALLGELQRLDTQLIPDNAL